MTARIFSANRLIAKYRKDLNARVLQVRRQQRENALLTQCEKSHLELQDKAVAAAQENAAEVSKANKCQQDQGILRAEAMGTSFYDFIMAECEALRHWLKLRAII